MAITLVQGNPVRTVARSGQSTASLAYASAVTSGNLLVVTISGTTAQTLSSVDDNVNAGVWSLAVKRELGTGANVYMYYKLNTSAGTPTVTAHLSANSDGIQLTLYEVSGAGTLALDQTNNGTAGTGVSDAGNLNTTLANSILIAATENQAGESTIGSSFTAFLDSANGNKFAGAQYRIVSSISNYSTAFGTDTGGTWDAIAANFGESAAALSLGQIIGNWYHPGRNIVNMARFQPSLQQFGKVGSRFRKTLNQLGTRVGSKRSHDTD